MIADPGAAALAAKRHEQGFRMLAVGHDFGPMMAALSSDLKKSRAETTN